MDWESELFPANYWLETTELPPLQIVPHYSGFEWKLVRTYTNQEGGTSSRVVQQLSDLESAKTMLKVLERERQTKLRHRAARQRRLAVREDLALTAPAFADSSVTADRVLCGDVAPSKRRPDAAPSAGISVTHDGSRGGTGRVQSGNYRTILA